MKRSWSVSAALAALAFCGCASVPVRYYSLTPAAESSSKPPTVVCCTVELRSVHLPAEVDRPELVTRRSGEELDVLSNDVWLAPLRDEVRSALLDRIRRRLAETAAETSNTPPVTRRFIVFVDVERFESMLGQHSMVQVQWRVATANPSRPPSPMACETTVSIDVTDGVPALVRGHQQALAVVGDRIATDIVEFWQDGAPRCQPSA